MSERDAVLDSSETARLLAGAAGHDHAALTQLLERHRCWLIDFVAARLDPRLTPRLDPADIVQEVYLEVCSRLDDYLARRPVSFRTWVLKTAFDRLGKARRQHVVAASRSILREVHLDDRSSFCLVQAAVHCQSSDAPLKKLSRAELAQHAREAISRLSETDREVLLLRHIEGLDNQEIGYLFDLDPKTVSKRHGRALLRLCAELIADGFCGSDL